MEKRLKSCKWCGESIKQVTDPEKDSTIVHYWECPKFLYKSQLCCDYCDQLVYRYKNVHEKTCPKAILHKQRQAALESKKTAQKKGRK
jgi:hypothetical protein